MEQQLLTDSEDDEQVTIRKPPLPQTQDEIPIATKRDESCALTAVEKVL